VSWSAVQLRRRATVLDPHRSSILQSCPSEHTQRSEAHHERKSSAYLPVRAT